MQLLSGSDQQMEIFEKVVSSVVSYMPPNPTGSSWKHFISVQILPRLSIWSNRELQCLVDHAGCDPISWLYLQFGGSTVSSSKWLHRMDENKAIPKCWINMNGRIQKRKVHAGRLRKMEGSPFEWLLWQDSTTVQSCMQSSPLLSAACV